MCYYEALDMVYKLNDAICVMQWVSFPLRPLDIKYGNAYWFDIMDTV